MATTIDLDEPARFQVESEEGSRSATGSLSTDLCRCFGCTSESVLVDPQMTWFSTLRDKERNILKSIAEGYTNKEIATALNVALKR